MVPMVCQLFRNKLQKFLNFVLKYVKGPRAGPGPLGPRAPGILPPLPPPLDGPGSSTPNFAGFNGTKNPGKYRTRRKRRSARSRTGASRPWRARSRPVPYLRPPVPSRTSFFGSRTSSSRTRLTGSAGQQSIEPLRIPKMVMDNGHGAVRVRAQFSNITVIGATNYTILDVNSSRISSEFLFKNVFTVWPGKLSYSVHQDSAVLRDCRIMLQGAKIHSCL
ncbi:unnamed protein product [Nesidiocoris tenuis]|uniref:Uncharacterized protein n=1 Tax=Nesidiocoris tenuis TaxID=355587 RepID=A0A6H5G594_9HEMI|nr:unnamed protein product [Nesidiocoris tenuis]